MQQTSTPHQQPGPGPRHLYAYTVEEFETGNGQKARSWTRIGVAFPHKEGPGFNIQLKAIPINGQIVLLPVDAGADDDDPSNDGNDAAREPDRPAPPPASRQSGSRRR